MTDKRIKFVSGSDPLRPMTNAQCVMVQGVGSLDRALKREAPVLLPTLVQGSINTSNSRYSTSLEPGMTTSVVMKNPILAPYAGVKFHVHIDDELKGLKVAVFHGYNKGITSTTSNVSETRSEDLVNGDTFDFPMDSYGIQTENWDKAHRYYRIAFFSSTLEMSVDDIKEAIRLGYLAVTYDDISGSVVMRNPRATEIIEASKTNKQPTAHRNFVFTHISDVHGNGYTLMNSLRYSKDINSQALFVSGDVVIQSSYDGYDFVHDMCKDFGFPSFVCSGNHDGVGQTAAAFNNDFFSQMANTFGYVKSSRSIGYYYKDLAEAKIRVITLDCSDTSASYRINCVGTTQINWLRSTLNATPSGYGVIIMMHQPVGKPSATAVAKNPSFAKDYELLGSNSINTITWTGASDIKSAVDSFIEAGGEFIMYAVGHIHADIVGIIDGTSHTQLQAVVGTPNRMLDMHVDSTALGDGIGKGQDLFNAYVIDRTRKTVRVVRIGANVCEDLSERLVEEFSYV